MKKMAASLSWDSCSEKQKACVWWVEKYFKDCVCDASSETSFGLGFVSLVCWGIAEIPQIFTNFKNKSGHGVSLGLLLTWVVGDIFNLVGCVLETVTLPTQFYTALLYTATTVVLVLQTVYYDYWLRWRESRSFGDKLGVEENRKPLNPSPEDSSKPMPTGLVKASTKMDVYYWSARSLASSGTPPHGLSSSSYLKVATSGPSAVTLRPDSSSEDEAASPAHHHLGQSRVATKPKPILSRSMGYGIFLIASAAQPFQSKAFTEVTVGFSRRELLQETGMKALEGNPYGVWLGWIMAAIYMGGRLPQIYLNIKRGSVEGLNPLMFMFALIANATYVGSILVRSVEWERIKPNAPWLLDAIVCVLLDLFIMVQFVYYKFMHRRTTSYEDDSYIEAKKQLV